MREVSRNMTTDELREQVGLSNEQMCEVLELSLRRYEAIKGEEVTVEQFGRVRKIVGSSIDRLLT